VFALLQKRREDRPADADAVLAALEPFATADTTNPASAARTGGTLVPPPGMKHDTVPTPAAAASESLGRSPARAATAKRPVSVVSDTIGLVERAAAPREISWSVALVVIVIASLVAGGLTYLVKAATASAPDSVGTASSPDSADW
jgi:hypothetical protein